MATVCLDLYHNVSLHNCTRHKAIGNHFLLEYYNAAGPSYLPPSSLLISLLRSLLLMVPPGDVNFRTVRWRLHGNRNLGRCNNLQEGQVLVMFLPQVFNRNSHSGNTPIGIDNAWLLWMSCVIPLSDLFWAPLVSGQLHRYLSSYRCYLVALKSLSAIPSRHINDRT